MCEPEPKVTAGAMIVAWIGPKIMFTGMAVLGSGVFVVTMAGSMFNAYVGMLLFGWSAIATILLLRRRADPVRRTVAVPTSAPKPKRVELIASRRLPELESSSPVVTYTVEQQRVIRESA